MRSALALASVLLGTTPLGCGGDDDGGGSPAGDGGAIDGGGGAQLAAVCQEGCEHAAECGWITDADDCAAACAGGVDILRTDAILAQWECLRDLPCETDNAGETCLVEVVGELDAHDIHGRYSEDCVAVEEMCDGLVGNVCAVQEVIMFNDDYMELQVMPCLDLACDAARACLEEKVLDAI